jgi:hypothetical protein
VARARGAIRLQGSQLEGSDQHKDIGTMNRNLLYLVIGVLAAVAIGLGYHVYQERQKPQGIDISIGKGGISIEKK